MLTDIQCKNATCPSGKSRARFADAGGLYLEVSPAGSKRWFLKYRKDGKEMRLALGTYPLVSLANARIKQSEAKALKHKGIDPVHAKQVGKLIAARQADDTFEAIAREWHSKQISNWSEVHAKTVMRRMERENASKVTAHRSMKPGDASDPSSYKVRRGKVGGYREDFPAEQVAELEALVRDNILPELGYCQDSQILGLYLNSAHLQRARTHVRQAERALEEVGTALAARGVTEIVLLGQQHRHAAACRIARNGLVGDELWCLAEAGNGKEPKGQGV